MSVSSPSRPARGQFVGVVVVNKSLCREHFGLTLRVDGFPPTQPGMFVQVACRDVDDAGGLASGMPLLRRPFSLAGRRDSADGSVEIDLIHRVVGVGTHWMSRLREGDSVSIIGPIGNAFTPPPPGGIALLVGGGVGVPPMIYLASMFAGRKAVAFCGAMSRDLIPLTVSEEFARSADPRGEEYQASGSTFGDAKHRSGSVGSVAPLYNVAEFSRHGIPAVLTTDDGSHGLRGYVTDALTQYLDAYLTDNADRGRAVIYTCGPEPMMKAVQAIAARRSIACQIAVERAMACGLGTCQSCCVRVRKPDPKATPMAGSEWCYRLACTDGPVFEGAELLW